MDSMIHHLKLELRNREYIFDNRKTLSSLLSDCFPSEKAMANQLITAFDCGIVGRLLELSQRDDFLKQRLVSEIQTKYGYDGPTSAWIISTWMYCIDDYVSSAYKRHIQAENDKRSLKKQALKSLQVDEDLALPVSGGKSPEGMLIPCGVGNDDGGFLVRGIKEANECMHKYSSLFSVIFNYLQRNTSIDEKSEKPECLRQYEKQLAFEFDYRKIYRLMIIILLFVKNNLVQNDVVSFGYDGGMEEIKAAFQCLNKYLSLLCRLSKIHEVVSLKYQNNQQLKVTLGNSSGDVSTAEFKGRSSKRIIWYAKKIIYTIEEDSKEDLECLLHEISPYKVFNAGQFQALRDMLNSQAHTVCIMPTGAGKSLIFYICAILQPGVSFVISPTELLISDQIENLKQYHKFDDVNHLQYEADVDFSDFIPQNKIYYLTPETFQNRDLLKEFILLNSNKKIANLILDEVHCISNWSHDFRPEYLMLSNYLNKYLDRTYYKCFTATANYTVIKDIKNQLQITDDKNIISPIKLEKHNIMFAIHSCDTVGEMATSAVSFLKKNLIKGQKTLVFTKNDASSQFLQNSLDDIKFEASVYRKSDRKAYKTFSKGQSKILIASDELGIGINLSDVHNVLHFGLPISKGEYVQEIGRAGRHGEGASSLVVYLACNTTNIKEQLLQRNTSTAQVLDIIKTGEQNDYTDAYRKFIGSIQSQTEFMDLIIDVYKTVKQINGFREIDFSLDTIFKTKRCLFVLYVIGFINNWSICDVNSYTNTVKILVAVNKMNQRIEQIKERTREYLYLVGGNKKSISLVGSADSVEAIICIYVDWYYNHFIYHHKEQFLDMLAFFESYKSEGKASNCRQEINNRLAAYFSLSMLEISQDEAKYANLSYKNIAETIISGVDYKTVSSIQRINQDNNNVKLDYFLFVYSYVYDKEYDSSRMVRILSAMEEEDFMDFMESVSILYEISEIDNRFILFNMLQGFVEENRYDFEAFFDMIFRQNHKDINYYGVMARRLNATIGG